MDQRITIRLAMRGAVIGGRRTIRIFESICACAALIAITCTAEAASVPAAVYNKAISVSFVVSSNAVCDSGRAGGPRQVQRTIYISSKGRIFSQTESRLGSAVETVQRSPEDTTMHFRFEGNRLIGVSTHFASGANQLVITSDSGFQTCTATMQFGRESGKVFKFRGVNGEMCTVTGAPTTSTPSCSIRAGNPFAQ
jgi:hypothetical protein